MDAFLHHAGEAGEPDVFRPVVDPGSGKTEMVPPQERPPVQAGPDRRGKPVQHGTDRIPVRLLAEKTEIAAYGPLPRFRKLFIIRGVHDDVFAAFLRLGDHCRQIVRIEPVVGVQKINIFPPGGVEALVPGGGYPPVSRETDQLKTFFFPGHRFEEGGRTVRGSIVHTDDFNIPERLLPDGADGPGKEGLHVVDGDDDGYFRNHTSRVLMGKHSGHSG